MKAMMEALDAIPVAEFYEGRVIWSCDPNEVSDGTDLFTSDQMSKSIDEAIKENEQ